MYDLSKFKIRCYKSLNEVKRYACLLFQPCTQLPLHNVSTNCQTVTSTRRHLVLVSSRTGPRPTVESTADTVVSLRLHQSVKRILIGHLTDNTKWFDINLQMKHSQLGLTLQLNQLLQL